MQPEDQVRASRLMPLLAVAGVIALAAALRLYAFTWGLPDATHMFSYHPDEFHSLRGALSLAMGDTNPHFFNYGSLYLYLVAIAAMIGSSSVFASVAGATVGGPEFPAAIQAWTLDARVVTLILSLATVYVVYLIATRIWGHRAGLLAAGALAVMPLHVVHSHYATVDVPGAFFVALALYFAVRLMDEPTGRNLVWAGVAAGLAASVKYSGGLVIVAPLVAWLMSARDGDRLRWIAPLTIIGGAALAFALTSPYTFLDWGNAWRDISFEMAHMRAGDDAVALARDPNGWWFHLKQLNIALTWPLLAVALWGAVTGLRTRRRELVPLAVFGALAFAVMGSTAVRYARYEMVLLPVVAALIGWTLAEGKPVKLRLIALVVVVIGLGMCLHTSRQFLVQMGPRGSRDDAMKTLAHMLPGDATIGLMSEPWFHQPPVDYCNGGPALRSNPIWGAYKRPLREIEVIGPDALALYYGVPDAFIYTDYDAPPHDEYHAKFWGMLDWRYRVVSPQKDPGRGMWPEPAHDWQYMNPGIVLCFRDDLTEAVPDDE